MSEPVGGLVRTRGGSVVHRSNCQSVVTEFPRSRPVPWLWAIGRSREEIEETIKFFDYVICKDCVPFVLDKEFP